MLHDREAQPISILFFMFGIAVAAGAFFAFVYLGPAGTPNHFAQRADTSQADTWPSVTQLQDNGTGRNARDM